MTNKPVSGRLDIEGDFFNNFNNPVDQINDYHLFDRRANAIVLEMMQLLVEKEPTIEHPLGFKLDVIGGDAARALHARGLGSWDNTVDLTEFYVRYKAPLGRGLDIDVGKFLTFVGGESTPAIDNWNFSRSFLYNYGPFTNTGIRMKYEFSDRYNAQILLLNGWDDFKDNDTGKTLGLSFGYNPNDKINLYFNYMIGPEQDHDNRPTRHYFDWVANVKLAKDWQAMVNFDYGDDYANGLGKARWSGVEGIIRHDFTDSIALSIRAEVFDDTNGYRTGVPQNLKEITISPEFKLPGGVVIRPEYRIDWSNVAAFNHGTKKSQGILGIGVMYAVPFTFGGGK